jgi:hypothetical protein
VVSGVVELFGTKACLTHTAHFHALVSPPALVPEGKSLCSVFTGPERACLCCTKIATLIYSKGQKSGLLVKDVLKALDGQEGEEEERTRRCSSRLNSKT